MKFQKFIHIIFVILIIFGLTACTLEKTSTTETKDEHRKKTVTLLFSFGDSQLDPHLSWLPLRAGITETLVKLNDKLQLEPWLATDWEQKDKNTWVFTIRDGVTFHDGTLLDAKAVKASLERGIRVSKALEKSLKIESIEANGQTLTIRTKEPHPSLVSELVNPNTSIISVRAEEEMGTDEFNKAPVGTGPFKVKKFTPDIEINLDRYEDYWDGMAKVEEVFFKFHSDANVRAVAFQSKEADIVYHLPVESIDEIEKDPDLKVESIPSLRAHFILYNMQKPELQDVKVRQAIDLLLSRKDVVNTVMAGQATIANGPFHSKFSFSNDGPAPSFDPNKAKQLLLEAGWKEENGQLVKNGKPLTFKLVTYASRPELPLIAQLLQAEAKKIGVSIDIQTVENIDSYLYEHQKEWDLATYSNLTAPRGDGGYYLNIAYLPNGALNPGLINIPSLNELIHELNVTSEQEKRNELTKQAVQIIAKEIPQSFVVYPNIVVGVNNRVMNWSPGAEEYYLITNKMDVK
ncbi:nickel ABC transporter substrate-binding protein [Aeribacillus pallidus]|uniref:nickel ABC transporter substrate-binding protein n=1 Tax=Aeribacillus pallidus TaxID=33936 RepID=UPI003D19378F